MAEYMKDIHRLIVYLITLLIPNFVYNKCILSITSFTDIVWHCFTATVYVKVYSHHHLYLEKTNAFKIKE